MISNLTNQWISIYIRDGVISWQTWAIYECFFPSDKIIERRAMYRMKVSYTRPRLDFVFHSPSSAPKAASSNLRSPGVENDMYFTMGMKYWA